MPYLTLPRDELRSGLECKLSGAPLHSLSVLPRLGNVAWIYGDRLSCGGLEQMFAELDIEVDPWEWLGKVLPKGLFAVISIDFHLRKICFSGQ